MHPGKTMMGILTLLRLRAAGEGGEGPTRREKGPFPLGTRAKGRASRKQEPAPTL